MKKVRHDGRRDTTAEGNHSVPLTWHLLWDGKNTDHHGPRGTVVSVHDAVALVLYGKMQRTPGNAARSQHGRWVAQKGTVCVLFVAFRMRTAVWVCVSLQQQHVISRRVHGYYAPVPVLRIRTGTGSHIWNKWRTIQYDDTLWRHQRGPGGPLGF